MSSELPESREMQSKDDPVQDIPDPTMLIDLGRIPMPFGRYKGRKLIDLPEPYVVWFRKQGFPRGRLGMLFGLLYEIKANGLEHLVPRQAGKAGGEQRELRRENTAGAKRRRGAPGLP